MNNFDWSIAAKELEYKDGDGINIGWYCSDRICRKGSADKIAFGFERTAPVENPDPWANHFPALRGWLW